MLSKTPIRANNFNPPPVSLQWSVRCTAPETCWHRWSICWRTFYRRPVSRRRAKYPLFSCGTASFSSELASSFSALAIRRLCTLHLKVPNNKQRDGWTFHSRGTTCAEFLHVHVLCRNDGLDTVFCGLVYYSHLHFAVVVTPDIKRWNRIQLWCRPLLLSVLSLVFGFSQLRILHIFDYINPALMFRVYIWHNCREVFALGGTENILE